MDAIQQIVREHPITIMVILLAVGLGARVMSDRMSESEKNDFGNLAIGVIVVLAAIFMLVKFIQWAANA